MSSPRDARNGRHRALCIAVGLGMMVSWAAITETSHAQRADPEGYRALVREAVTEFDAQNYPEAHTLFRQAHELYPNARTLRGLGLSAFELRRYAESVTLLEQSLSASERRLDGDMRQATERVLERAKRLVGELALTIEPADAIVSVDDRPVKVTPGVPLRLDVGTRKLQFRASGFHSEQRIHRVEGGRLEIWNIMLRPLEARAQVASHQTAESAATPAKSIDATASDVHLTGAKWTTLALTLGTVSLAAVALGMREKRARDFRACDVGFDCSSSRDSGERWRFVAIGAGALSALMLSASIVLFVKDRPRRRASVERAMRACSFDAQTVFVRWDATF